jgi:hypothetical protein
VRNDVKKSGKIDQTVNADDEIETVSQDVDGPKSIKKP